MLNKRNKQIVEHELFTLPEHMNSPNVVSGVRVAQSLVNSVHELFTLPEHLSSPNVLVEFMLLNH
jgi:hypothetical protein